MNETTKRIGLAIVVLGAPLYYYYGVALPRQNQARLDFERQKYQDSVQEKETAKETEQKEVDDESRSLTECLLDAQQTFDDNLKHNGTPVPGKPGWYDASRDYLKELHREQEVDNRACRERYPKGH